ncbi:electron transfer flavoprotein subunit alpha/FixB family protein [Trueperella bialowiezensis]|uniref:Electron transfer flavoprotein large subunit n=1 Tax=Trueperella bialowiezensis TaxID=312285 RepID=A0A448PCH7_9ACTO|nr:electron transfer flavoprotein subunit alpha/FixB family protein [Trueperella bialowiezensis]VEI12679.1 Electron transfer flavoprotein large subunit [Trueperella bialowiezensis]
MTTWIVTTEAEISQLVDMAVGETVGVVVGEAEIGGVDHAIRIPCGNLPAEAMAPAVVNAVEAQDGDVILVLNNPAGRVLAGALAASNNAPVLRGLRELGEGSAVLGRYGGITHEHVTFDGVVVGLVATGEAVADPVAADSVDGESYPVSVVSEDIGEGAQVNLSAATRIVGVGRGFLNYEDLDLARALADAIGGEVGCTRPLVEGNGWMDRDAYLGVSGHTVAPEVYIPVGISGQIHHTSGIDEAETIVVVNNDETATIFEFADYGIVGNLYDVLPKMIGQLKK